MRFLLLTHAAVPAVATGIRVSRDGLRIAGLQVFSPGRLHLDEGMAGTGVGVIRPIDVDLVHIWIGAGGHLFAVLLLRFFKDWRRLKKVCLVGCLRLCVQVCAGGQIAVCIYRSRKVT